MGNELLDESLCDIIAEKRRSAEHIRNNLSTVPVRQWDQEAEIKSLEDEADRLDRARMKMEIEMANLRKENAKLREVLLKANGVLIEAAHHNLTEEYINECLALMHAVPAATEGGNDGR